MKLEKLNINKNKRIIISLVIFIVLIVTITLLTTRSKYRVTQSLELAKGTVNYTIPDFNLIDVYVEENGAYKGTDTIPQSGYTLNEEKSYCAINGEKDTTITIEYSDGNLNVNGLSKKGTKCYVYFDKMPYTCKGVACEAIMANMNAWKTRSSFDSVVTDTTTGVIYKSLDENQYDDNGEVYYFAGNPSDNWVKFGGFYWRIIRINGDGTIRMIYQGTAANITGNETQIGTSVFNTNDDDNMYVGYQYTGGKAHGTGTDSTVKEVLDNWYNNNLKDYGKYIATGGGASFCNDRTPYSGSGIGITETNYVTYNRLVTNKIPTFKCTDTEDRFAISVGLITADDVSYAGGVFNTNNSGYYLYTGEYYWTMSPYYFDPSYIYPVRVFLMWSDGYLVAGNVNANGFSGVRPVINLKADITFTGSGTSSDPYVVS